MECFLDQIYQTAFVENLSRVKGIDENLILPVMPLDAKVSGKPNSKKRKTQPPADFQVDHGERYRQSHAPVNHIIQITIAGVVIILLVAPELELLEKVTIEPFDFLARAVVLTYRRAYLAGNVIQASQV